MKDNAFKQNSGSPEHPSALQSPLSAIAADATAEALLFGTETCKIPSQVPDFYTFLHQKIFGVETNHPLIQQSCGLPIRQSNNPSIHESSRFAAKPGVIRLPWRNFCLFGEALAETEAKPGEIRG